LLSRPSATKRRSSHLALVRYGVSLHLLDTFSTQWVWLLVRITERAVGMLLMMMLMVNYRSEMPQLTAAADSAAEHSSSSKIPHHMRWHHMTSHDVMQLWASQTLDSNVSTCSSLLSSQTRCIAVTWLTVGATTPLTKLSESMMLPGKNRKSKNTVAN